MKKQSKFLSLILRHQPDAGGITLDANGWATTQSVLAALRAKFGAFSRTELNELVETNDKKRFAFSPHGDRIRANQGHSIEVDLKLDPKTPPAKLYHGTKQRFLGEIFAKGLVPMARQHVHLSGDLATAEVVANRRSGDSVILAIDAAAMSEQVFYQSDNGVWLTDRVDPKYISLEV